MLETLLRRLDMVRLTIGVAAMVLAMGCSGLIDDGGSGGLTPAQAKARELFLTKALPQLTTNCAVCHNGSRTTANIGFLEGASDIGIRDTLVAYEPLVINLDAPGSSRLITKGLHEGPALDAIQTSDILEWIQAEKEAVGDGERGPTFLATEPALISICTGGLPDDPAAPNPNCLVNNVSLDAVGETPAVGAKISFVVQALGSGLYMTNLRLVPGAGGAFIEHPLFVAHGNEGAARQNCELIDEATGAVVCADTIDRYFNVKLNLQMAATPDEQLIGGGAGAFVGFLPTDKLSIHFKAVKPFEAEGPGPGEGGGGCKDLPAFKAMAQSAFNANVGAGAGGQNCAQCHAGANANATAAMGITQINSADDAQLLLACNQIRTRLNFQNFDLSSVVLAVDPGNANHPVRFNAADFATFKSRINPWFIAERDAP
jgi:mono/diheme cytochrome c family protein